jgi:hypothetical protein
MTPAGIELVTFRFVAQRLNHYSSVIQLYNNIVHVFEYLLFYNVIIYLY